ncbi:hypothetical protein SPI_03021 [Niveomyces insectorum RCEF 264]|uniref:Uncharacterized protein n=1 Tax=Niveomyces insectorum RCEF 264 TaxID=1081102 RepID=A0A167X037_9HYPO|nr:hypothetical protein SPI_03021 [Niveomyces insectorum RCEF 264]
MNVDYRTRPPSQRPYIDHRLPTLDNVQKLPKVHHGFHLPPQRHHHAVHSRHGSSQRPSKPKLLPARTDRPYPTTGKYQQQQRRQLRKQDQRAALWPKQHLQPPVHPTCLCRLSLWEAAGYRFGDPPVAIMTPKSDDAAHPWLLKYIHSEPEDMFQDPNEHDKSRPSLDEDNGLPGPSPLSMPCSPPSAPPMAVSQSPTGPASASASTSAPAPTPASATTMAAWAAIKTEASIDDGTSDNYHYYHRSSSRNDNNNHDNNDNAFLYSPLFCCRSHNTDNNNNKNDGHELDTGIPPSMVVSSANLLASHPMSLTPLAWEYPGHLDGTESSRSPRDASAQEEYALLETKYFVDDSVSSLPNGLEAGQHDLTLYGGGPPRWSNDSLNNHHQEPLLLHRSPPPRGAWTWPVLPSTTSAKSEAAAQPLTPGTGTTTTGNSNDNDGNGGTSNSSFSSFTSHGELWGPTPTATATAAAAAAAAGGSTASSSTAPLPLCSADNDPFSLLMSIPPHLLPLSLSHLTAATAPSSSSSSSPRLPLSSSSQHMLPSGPSVSVSGPPPTAAYPQFMPPLPTPLLPATSSSEHFEPLEATSSLSFSAPSTLSSLSLPLQALLPCPRHRRQHKRTTRCCGGGRRCH